MERVAGEKFLFLGLFCDYNSMSFLDIISVLLKYLVFVFLFVSHWESNFASLVPVLNDWNFVSLLYIYLAVVDQLRVWCGKLHQFCFGYVFFLKLFFKKIWYCVICRDLQSYLSDLSLFLATESNRLYILVDNRPWLRDLGPAHLWQFMVTKVAMSYLTVIIE